MNKVMTAGFSFAPNKGKKTNGQPATLGPLGKLLLLGAALTPNPPGKAKTSQRP